MTDVVLSLVQAAVLGLCGTVVAAVVVPERVRRWGDMGLVYVFVVLAALFWVMFALLLYGAPIDTTRPPPD